jgi:site-specific DNA recombinase
MNAQPVAIYARVSSEQQAEEGTIESQLAALRQRVAQDGYQVSEESWNNYAMSWPCRD